MNTTILAIQGEFVIFAATIFSFLLVLLLFGASANMRFFAPASRKKDKNGRIIKDGDNLSGILGAIEHLQQFTGRVFIDFADEEQFKVSISKKEGPNEIVLLDSLFSNSIEIK